jgi:ligand-binding SRPBCC domain-containing protein
MSRVHLLEREQRVELSRERAFEFYGDAHNLEAITPPWLGFEVTTPGPIEMGPGTGIEYRLKLHGVPVRWRTRIEVWEPPTRFVDVQVSGPYALWEHTHEFEPATGGTVLIRDRVRYALPLGPLGELAHRLFVRRDVERIFDYRREAVAVRLAGAAA